MNVGIQGAGCSLPEAVVPSTEIEGRLGLARGTVAGALGVRERRVAAPHEAVSDLAVRAAAPLAHSIDLLILATSTPDHLVPSTAPQVAARLGLSCPAFDLMNTCSGWTYGVAVAERFASSGQRVLVIGANVLSRRLRQDDWSTAGLFADGAGAVVVAPVGSGGIRGVALGADGTDWMKIMVPAGGSRFPVDAQRVAAGEHLLRVERAPGMLERSATMAEAAARQALAQAGWKPDDVDWFVPHQANIRLVREIARRVGINEARTVVHLERYGNTSAASIPIALAELSPRLEPGMRILTAVSAAGMTSGALAIEWTGEP